MYSFRNDLFYLILLGICLNKVISSSETTTTETKKKVCVIGAGAAGLVSAQQLANYPDIFDFVVFERNNDIGGIWKYTDSVDLDENKLPVHSSVYANLRTNLPKEIMALPNYRNFFGENRSCVTHRTVLAYWRNFTDYFSLNQFIKFNHLVKNVTPVIVNDNSQSTKWHITVWDIHSNATIKTNCDAVIVCNGHYSNPRIPYIAGIDSFSGKVIHSHIYRRPEVFINQTVIVLGAAASGIDIGIEISEYAKTVYLSHNKQKISTHLPSNMIQVPGIVAVNGSIFTLKDGTTVIADALVLCTGYVFAFPFLGESSGIKVEDNQVAPVYQHIVNVEHPSMFFIGLPVQASHFPLFHMQAQYIISLLRGKAELPSKEEMLKKVGDLNGKPKRYAHFLDNAQWAYNDELAQAGGFKPLPDFYKKGYKMWMAHRSVDALNYKKSNLRILENGDVEIIHPTE